MEATMSNEENESSAIPLLSVEQREALRREIRRADLDDFDAVWSARTECALGHFDSALAYLRSDAESIRAVSPTLYEFITDQLPR